MTRFALLAFRLALLGLFLLGVPRPAGAYTATEARKLAAEKKNSGVKAYQDGRLSQAITDLGQAVGINLNDFFAHYYLGLALRDARRYAEARAVLEVAAELDPRYLQVYVALGDVALGLGEPNQADAEFRRALERQANYAPGLDGLGRLAEARGDTTTAIERYREAITANRGFPLPYVHLGAVYLRQGRRDDAVALFQDAIRFRPDFADGYHFLGVTYGQLGQRDEAIALLEKAAGLEPENPSHPLALGRLAASWDDRVRARDYLERARGLAPDRPEPLLALAELARRSGDYEKAVALLAAALRIEGIEESVAADVRGRLDAWQAEAARRRELEQKLAGQTAPEGGAERLALARLRRDAGDLPGALEDCRAALEPMGRPPDLLAECGYYGVAARRYEQAAELLEDASARDGTDETALINLGLAYSGLGRATSAIESYRKALQISPRRAEASLYLGNTLYRIGRLPEARAAWNDALRNTEDPVLIDRLRKLLEQLEEKLATQPDGSSAPSVPPAGGRR